ncbi:MAG: NAD(P)H-binding protein [Chitinivibrionales bacterium]|nr:NAD(P)H-binding protein [Chitinivibrionales bacterium]
MVVITGATGNTGSKIAQTLINKREKVVLIGRSEEKLRKFGGEWVKIMAGDQSDPRFLTRVFFEADVVYLMIPPKLDANDLRLYYNNLGDAALKALKDARCQKVVFLSSLGVDQETGTGPILGIRDVEQKLDTLKGVDIVFLRAGNFMENLLMNIPTIKKNATNSSTVHPDSVITMVATKDIADKAAALLVTRNFTGHSIIEVFGDRLSLREATAIIGSRINKPNLSYVHLTDSDAIRAYENLGVSPSVANSYIQMAHALSENRIMPRSTDPNRPTSSTTFRLFVDEFFLPLYTKPAELEQA